MEQNYWEIIRDRLLDIFSAIVSGNPKDGVISFTEEEAADLLESFLILSRLLGFQFSVQHKDDGSLEVSISTLTQGEDNVGS